MHLIVGVLQKYIVKSFVIVNGRGTRPDKRAVITSVDEVKVKVKVKG